MINGVRDPLDVLILGGKRLIERLRRMPVRRIARLGDSAERLLLAMVNLDALLAEIAVVAGNDGMMTADGGASDVDAGELPVLIETMVDDAIDDAGTNPEHVDVRVGPLPNGWMEISIENTARGRSGEVDFLRLFEAIKRSLGYIGLTVAGDIVTVHGGRILTRPTQYRRPVR